MKTLSLLAAAALGLSGAIASAQTQGTTTAPSDTTTSPMPSAAQTAPSATSSTTATSTTGTQPTVDLRSEPSPPEDLRAAREEAVNALAWAKSEGCRSDPSPRDCMRQAQEDYRATMARLGNRSGGTVSASGTSAATGSQARAQRSDRH